MEVIFLLIGLLVGLSAGAGIAHLLVRSKSVGSLQVNCTDPETPDLYLVLDVEPSVLVREKYVQMTVNKITHISQK